MQTAHIKAANLRQCLCKAFKVQTSKELKRHLKKTDLRRKDELIHAVAVLWFYGQSYEIKNCEVLGAMIDSFSDELLHKAAYEAKHGFGAYDQ